MTILEALKPKTFYESLSQVIRNYSNWVFYKKTMVRLFENGTLKQYGLRLDSQKIVTPAVVNTFTNNVKKPAKTSRGMFSRPKYRAYYVLNLEPETLMMGSEVLELEKSRIYESLLKKKVMFEDAGLGELIEAKTDRIKTDDFYAYLIQIKYRSTAAFSDVAYILLWAVSVVTLTYFVIHWSIAYKAIFAWILSTMTAK